MWSVLCFPVFFILCAGFIQGNEISFLKYCSSENNPDMIPKDGKESSGSLVMTSDHGSEPWYLPGLNCSVTITTEKNFHIFLAFSNVSLRNASMDNLTVFYDSGDASFALSGQQVCSNENCVGLKFDSGKYSNITLKFISANVSVPLNVTGFVAQYTVYDVADPATGACRRKHRFLCENKNCVSYDLVCDGHNNCGDLSDETKCIIPVRSTVWGIIVIVTALIAVVVFVPMFCFLATSGTRNMVKSVTLPNAPVPLSNAIDCGETSNLLTSSEAVNQCWPGSSYERSSSFTYGSAGSSANLEGKKKPRSSSGGIDSQGNHFL